MEKLKYFGIQFTNNMARYKLKADSEFTKRFDELCSKAEELGIDISWPYSNTQPTVVTDLKNQESYELRDVDNSEFLNSFPPMYEYKLTFDEE